MEGGVYMNQGVPHLGDLTLKVLACGCHDCGGLDYEVLIDCSDLGCLKVFDCGGFDCGGVDWVGVDWVSLDLQDKFILERSYNKST